VRILGVDPGSRITGYALLESERGEVRFLEGGILKTRGAEAMPARLAALGEGMEALLARWRPEQAAVEDLFHAVNARSALKLAQARGVILASLSRAGLPVSEYTPLQVKKAVSGYGMADKDALRALVERLLRIPAGVLTRDASDAVAVALCHAQAAPFRSALSAADARESSAMSNPPAGATRASRRGGAR
jgi:crossover junction endodeoxyribonuclease RuvC